MFSSELLSLCLVPLTVSAVTAAPGNGAAPKPFVGILNVTEGGVLLRCEVPAASPKPKVEWQDSDGSLLPAEEPQVSHRGDRLSITLLTTVTRTNTNRFLCVATQEELSHVIQDEIHVPDQLFESCRGDGVLIAAFVCGVFSAVVLIAVSVCFLYITL